jgi:hypothetical protein
MEKTYAKGVLNGALAARRRQKKSNHWPTGWLQPCTTEME